MFTTVYALFGGLIPWRRIVATHDVVGRQTSATAYLASLQQIPMSRICFGWLLTIVVQLALFWGLDLTFWGWAACYACFGLMWSSLQYADHAFSPLDEREGAWNLTVSAFTRMAFLNYHFHLCHHRNPTVPWRSLPEQVRQDDASLAFRHILYFMWAGPRLKPGETLPSDTIKKRGLTVNLFLTAIMTLVFWIIYVAGDALHAAAVWRGDLTTAFDRIIPFYPAAAAVYLCVLPMLLAAPFVFRTPERLLPFGVAIVVELLVALAIYYVFPTEVPAVSYDPSGVIRLAHVARGHDQSGCRQLLAIAAGGAVGFCGLGLCAAIDEGTAYFGVRPGRSHRPFGAADTPACRGWRGWRALRSRPWAWGSSIHARNARSRGRRSGSAHPFATGNTDAAFEACLGCNLLLKNAIISLRTASVCPVGGFVTPRRR